MQARVNVNYQHEWLQLLSIATTSAGNLHTQVLANAILPIYRFAVNIFPLQKTMKNELVISYHKKFVATRGCKLFILMMIFFHEMDYAIWQIFYAIDLQPRVAANSYHKKFAKFHN